MQKIIDTGKTLIMVVDVPEGYIPLVVDNIKMYRNSKVVCNNTIEKRLDWITLNEDSWQILGLAKDVTEEQMEILVKNYKDGCDTVMEGWLSIVQYHQIQPNDLLLIEKK